MKDITTRNPAMATALLISCISFSFVKTFDAESDTKSQVAIFKVHDRLSKGMREKIQITIE